MKNSYLFIILIILFFVAYCIDEKDEVEVKSLLNIGEVQNISKVESQNYILIKEGELWKINGRVIDLEFMRTYLSLIKSIEIIEKCSLKTGFKGRLKLFVDNSIVELNLGELLVGDNGFHILKNGNCYRVSNQFTEGLLYKNDLDRAQKQYLMIKNIFFFNESNIKLKSE